MSKVHTGMYWYIQVYTIWSGFQMVRLQKCIYVYVHVYDFPYLYIPCLSANSTIALYIHGTYMVQTCLYTSGILTPCHYSIYNAYRCIYMFEVVHVAIYHAYRCSYT